MVINKEFWGDKRVLVTGHTGFKGGWLSLWLQSLGANVTGYSLSPHTKPSLFDVARVDEGMKSVIGDIRDLAHFKAIFRECRPEIVFHMAAQALVRSSYENPVETYSSNVMGTVHLLDAVRQTSGVRAVVNITSDKCYNNREWAWGYRENEPMGGYDPYSSSKGCAELIANAYRNSYFNSSDYDRHGVAIASARAGNVIGGGDWALDRLIPDILRAVQIGEPVRIRSPHAVRPWQHVLEPLNGYLQLAQKLFEDGSGYAEGWNFGPNDEDAKPVQWIVEQLTQQWGEGAHWELDAKPQPHEANFLKLDCSKAKSRLGWQPQWGLAQTLEEIIEWYRAYQAGENMHERTILQIDSYQSKIPQELRN